jgi:divinyl protochlorophyllide a 8-vinyl-reductase
MTAAVESGRIGPNAILQYLPVLEREVGSDGLASVLAGSALYELPDGTEMIAESDAARFHHVVRSRFPNRGPRLARLAGMSTADYIIANRIPAAARAVLRILPIPVAESMLCRAIAEHAWTFSGSGEFRMVARAPITFEIAANPLAVDSSSAEPICDWHAAVFRRLFESLIEPGYEAFETACIAAGGDACRFELRRVR